MKICRVLEPVVSTVKHPEYEGLTLFCVMELDASLEDTGKDLIAVDCVQAGPGDIVLVMQEGNGVRQIFKKKDKFPIRSVIVGFVDEVHT